MESRNRHKVIFKKKLLSISILSLLSPLSSASFAETMTFSDGQTHFESSITLDDTLNNSTALTVINDMSYVINTGLMNISSTGDHSTGISADSGANATMAAGGTLTVSGIGSRAVIANNESIFVLNSGVINHLSKDENSISSYLGSVITLSHDIINSSASNGNSAIYSSGANTQTSVSDSTIMSNADSALGNGIKIEDHATLNLTNSNIQQTNGLNGIYINTNSVFNGSGVSITNNADGAISSHITGLSLNNSSTANITESATQLNSVILKTTGDVIATGIFAGENTRFDLHNMNVNVEGSESSTALFAAEYSTVNIFGGSYQTTSTGSSEGIYVSDTAALTATDNFSVSTFGDHVNAIDVYGTASLTNGSSNTSGDWARALYVEGETTASNMHLEVAGQHTEAASAANGGNLLVNQGSVLIARGDNSSALVNYQGSTITANNIQAETFGNGSGVIVPFTGSSTTITDSQIKSHGAGSALIATQGINAGEAAGTVTVNSSLLASDRYGIIETTGANLNVILNQGTVVSAGNGVLVAADNLANSGNPLASQVNLTVNGPSVTGNIVAQQNEFTKSLVNLNLNSGSVWSGSATNGNDLNIDNTSTWNVTDNSNINSITSNGAVVFSHISTSYSTLTIANDLRGSGSYTLNTYLSDSDSPTDKIHVLGNVYDTHKLFINSTGGTGARTEGNGIEVVQVDGTDNAANGSFTLGNRVAVGAYEYSLRRGDITTGEGNDWYLSTCSDYNCTSSDGGDGGNTDDGNGGNTDGDNGGNTDGGNGGNTDGGNGGNSMSGDNAPWRQEVPGYIAAPVLNIRYGFDSLGTYHQRTGGDVSHNDGAWGRVFGQHNNYDAGRFSYDTDTWYAQLGADLKYDKDDYNTERTAGVLITLGRQATDAQDSVRSRNSALSVNTGDIHSDIYSVGGYYTIKAQDGGYIDTIGMASLYRNKYESASDATQHGFGVAMSVEAGKPYVLHDNLKIEPQAQLKYQYLNLNSFHDDISYVSGVTSSSGEARGGLRLFLDNPTVTPYLTLDAVTTIGNEPQVQIGDQKLRAEFSDNWWQTGAGVASKISENTSIYSDIRYIKGFNSSMEGYAGDVGLKINF